MVTLMEIRVTPVVAGDLMLHRLQVVMVVDMVAISPGMVNPHHHMFAHVILFHVQVILLDGNRF